MTVKARMNKFASDHSLSGAGMKLNGVAKKAEMEIASLETG